MFNFGKMTNKYIQMSKKTNKEIKLPSKVHIKYKVSKTSLPLIQQLEISLSTIEFKQLHKIHKSIFRKHYNKKNNK